MDTKTVTLTLTAEQISALTDMCEANLGALTEARSGVDASHVQFFNLANSTLTTVVEQLKLHNLPQIAVDADQVPDWFVACCHFEHEAPTVEYIAGVWAQHQEVHRVLGELQPATV